MAEAPVEITESGAAIITPRGRIDSDAAPALRDQLRGLVQSGNVQVVVDLSAVDLLDSAGLSALISGLKAARQAGGNLQIARPSKQARTILKLTNLHHVLELYAPDGDESR